MIKLVIPYVPESYNVIKNWHWAEKYEYNQSWYWQVKSCWSYWQEDHRLPELPFQKAKVDIYIYFPNPHRRDKINYAQGCKPILDQLGKESILVDDNWERVDDNYHQRCDREHPRIEIVIEKIKEE